MLYIAISFVVGFLLGATAMFFFYKKGLAVVEAKAKEIIDKIDNIILGFENTVKKI